MNAYVDCGYWRIHYKIQGEGPVLILLHGGAPGSSGSSSFAKNIERLSQRFRVYAIDFPGWGKSSYRLTPAGQLVNPMEIGGEVVAAFMQALGIKNAHLLGGSFGGSAALYTALNHPELVNRLVLVAPGGGDIKGQLSPGLVSLLTYYSGEGPTFEKYKTLMYNMVFDPTTLPNALMKERFALTNTPEAIDGFPLRLPPGGLSQPLPMLFNNPRLGDIKSSVLFVWGKDDAVQPITALDSFSPIPNQVTQVFDDCGHWPYWEYPEFFNEAVMRFLNIA